LNEILRVSDELTNKINNMGVVYFSGPETNHFLVKKIGKDMVLLGLYHSLHIFRKLKTYDFTTVHYQSWHVRAFSICIQVEVIN
jgi:hypothetical protein